MRSPRSRAAGLGALCFFTLACTRGEGTPLMLSDGWLEVAADGGDDPPVETPPPPRMDAAMPTTQPKDAGSPPKPPPTSSSRSECDELDDEWPSEATRDANKLLDALDRIRADAVRECEAPMALPALRRNGKLQCSARLRLDRDAPPPFEDFSPAARWIGGRRDPETRDFYDRLERADFDQPSLSIELLITNTNSVESFVQSMRAYADVVCFVAAGAPVQLAGAARRDHVWVVDFSIPEPGGPGGP